MKAQRTCTDPDCRTKAKVTLTRAGTRYTWTCPTCGKKHWEFKASARSLRR